MRKLKRALAVLPAIVAALACNLIETGSPTRIAPTPTRVVIARSPTSFRPTVFPTFPSVASPVPRTSVQAGPTQQPPTGGLIPGCTPPSQRGHCWTKSTARNDNVEFATHCASGGSLA